MLAVDGTTVLVLVPEGCVVLGVVVTGALDEAVEYVYTTRFVCDGVYA